MSGQPSSSNLRRLSRATEYHHAGRHERAVSICARILKNEPGNLDAKCLMAVAGFERGDKEQAISLLTQALSGHPGEARLVLTLSELLLRVGNYPAAIAALRASLSVTPGQPDLEVRLGDALRLNGDTQQAAVLYSKVLDAQPEHIGARLSLADSIISMGDPTGAVAELEQAHALAPDSPEAAGALAELYEQLNRVDEAMQLANTALTRWPGELRLGLVAARCMRRSGKPGEALSLLDGLQLRDADPGERADYQFERGFLLDRLNEPEAAMAAFSNANTMAGQVWHESHPGPNAYAQKVRQLREAFTPELVAGWDRSDGPPPEQCPVFLTGFPRSGTTLLDQVLDSHPETQVIEERGLIAVLQHELASQGPFPGILASLDKAGIEKLRERYYALAGNEIEALPGRLLIDKLPLNITNAGLIYRVFPNARFVFAVRHPADVCLSCFMQNFRPTDAMANFFSLASTVEFYASAMALWQTYRERLPLTVHTVRYEDLLDDFRGQAGSLLEFLGLGWHDSVAAFHEHARRRARINTPSYHQVSQPLYTDARFRWHRYRAQLEPYLGQLAPWINAFGYEEKKAGAGR